MDDTARAARLNKLFNEILHGTPVTKHNGPRFLEALRAVPSHASCVNRIVNSPNGLGSLQAAMRFDLSDQFLGGPGADTIAYLQDGDLETIGGGDFLRQIIQSIVDPPFFWDAFLSAFKAKKLTSGGTRSFAWLLIQLSRLPGPAADRYIEVASDASLLTALTSSSDADTRSLGHKLKHIVETSATVQSADSDIQPGGRHDNDFPDFRKISILPTPDEVISKEAAFLRRYNPGQYAADPSSAVALCLDDQFRLLREDMLYEMKEELDIAFQRKKGHHRGLVVEGFTLLEDVFYGTDEKACRWGIALEAKQDFWFFKKVKDRKKFLVDNRNHFKHQSYTCLIVDGEVVAFPIIHRDEERLAKNIIILQLDGRPNSINALVKLKKSKFPNIKLIQIDTAIFSYEPVLQALQDMRGMPLADELLCWSSASTLKPPSYFSSGAVVESIKSNPRQDLGALLKIPKRIVLDESQVASLLAGLTQKVSLIQGPPGTGKSFIGALLAKVLHDSARKILVVCYTNHALDQFLEDILDMGVPMSSIVRLGGKSTSRTEPLSLQKQSRGTKLGAADYRTIDNLKQTSEQLRRRLENNWTRFTKNSPDLLAHIEFEDPEFFTTLSVPSSSGMIQVGKGGKRIDRWYLLNRWSAGNDAGAFKAYSHVLEGDEIWKMDRPSRQAKLSEWRSAFRQDQASEILNLGKAYNECQDEIERKFRLRDIALLQSKQIIGCTTTGAAKYTADIQAASPEVLIVEEAGEILESHVLVALGRNTKQVILIGDHKQLRPKVNNYLLTIEKGEGYDLNRSLFERLVLQEYPHETLSQQHRMRPEISALVRSLTYPELMDAPFTQNRPNTRGLRDNLVFIDHDKPEDENSRIKNQSELSSKSSKRNSHEAKMVLKVVKYLGQQGYGTDKLVILTPYLGQLSELQSVLSEENDPVLNDLDSHDLVRAGILPSASANANKRRLRLATIDNYQGEESDIVISCLTRSNNQCDIGFMFSPERLNVLLSRPRNAFIMIGNSHTFLGSRKGKELWTRFFDLMKQGGHIYDGLPVKCERHPDRTAILKAPIDFENECPDGGCKEPCGTMLKCGIHPCPSKCHQLYDHTKMECEHICKDKCPQNHPQSWKCSKGRPATCSKCELEAKVAEEKRQREFELQQKRDAAQQAYAQRLAAIDAEIAAKNQELQDDRIATERSRTIQQKEKDLEDAEARLAKTRLAKIAPPPSNTSSIPTSSIPQPAQPNTQDASPSHSPPTPESSRPVPPGGTTDYQDAPEPPPKDVASQHHSEELKIPTSASRDEWQRQKDFEGADNAAIDEIMAMVGLEEVKDAVLGIKAKIDTSLRQNVSLKDERFNVSFLGNPGTGKTTVARHYAKFLDSVGIIPGSEFVETTGSRLSNEGVPGTKKMLENMLASGGGVFFVDESYQLTSHQGPQVLDFLLAEMENNVGTVVFIFAGYEKEMEAFFEHNPGLTSRVPYQLKFGDYSDSELLAMLDGMMKKRFQGNGKIEGGMGGLYARVAVRRLGRGRGRPGFGNARALANLFATITTRQATRLTRQRKEGLKPDDFLLTGEDMIGPDPSKAALESTAWEKLQELVGLSSVKDSVRSLLSSIETNYHRELAEKEPLQMSLNQVFYGNPGTGKTTVAKLYGQILADLSLISKGEVVVKNPADFVGDVLGASEKQTKGILATTVGKVLVIDEESLPLAFEEYAYMLYGGSGGSGSHTDIYKTAVIDTIVAEVQSVPGDDRCVLMLGYEDKMVEMFQNVNPGLSRRFNIESAFRFEDFNDSELLQVLDLKLKSQHLDATNEAKKVAIDVLARARVRPNFGNAGEVENLLGLAKKRFERNRQNRSQNRSYDIVFSPEDFDPDFNRNSHAATNLTKLFEDVVGCEEIIGKLSQYQTIAHSAKLRGQDVRALIPTNWVFKGPPGTGKTTVARKMGQVYYDMGFLAATEVVECSASDLVGQYVGQTGPKTAKLFDKALGKVLFVDEAYRLQEGHFAKEAIDEVVGLLTQPKYQFKLVVILAGYDDDMNDLLRVNSGLSSRFPEELVFPNMRPEQCMKVLRILLKKADVELDDTRDGDMVNLIEQMARLRGWGNARDMTTISKKMIHTALLSADSDQKTVALRSQDAIDCIQAHFDSLKGRSAAGPSKAPSSAFGLPPPMFNAPPASSISTKTAQKSMPVDVDEATEEQESDGRDAGVSDAVWRQLQADKQAEEAEKKRRQEAIDKAERELREAEEREAKERERIAEAERLAAQAREQKERDEMKRRLEEMRLKELKAREERERRERELEVRRKAEELERQKEAKAQKALRNMGVCVAGYRWIKQAGGYRCAGGSHFVSDAQLGM